MSRLPNALTCLRIALVGVFPFAYYVKGPMCGLIVFLTASLTDLLDGYLARKMNAVTAFGQAMDPLADKLMLCCVLICLGLSGRILPIIAIIATVKETLMIIGGIVLYRHRSLVQPANALGKFGTMLFFVAVVMSFFSFEPYTLFAYIVALAMSLYAMARYAQGALVMLREANAHEAVKHE